MAARRPGDESLGAGPGRNGGVVNGDDVDRQFPLYTTNRGEFPRAIDCVEKPLSTESIAT